MDCQNEPCSLSKLGELDKWVEQHSGLPIEQEIVHYLFNYRNTPYSTTGVLALNEMIFKTRPRSRLDLLKPVKGMGNGKKRVSIRNFVKVPVFAQGEKVLIGNLGPLAYHKWKEETIVEPISPLTWVVEVEAKRMYQTCKYVTKDT